MSTGIVSFALGLNIKKSSKKNRVNYRLINNSNSPVQFAIKKLSGELERFGLATDARSAYIAVAKTIDNFTTMNMKYLAGALYWFYHLHNSSIPNDFIPEMFKDEGTVDIFDKISKNKPPTRSEYLQLATYITKINLTIKENLPSDEDVEETGQINNLEHELNVMNLNNDLNYYEEKDNS